MRTRGLLAALALLLSPAAHAADKALIERGAYLARAGDCVACHTAPGGAPFAGGLPFALPIGTIYSSNITPDKDTGIGTYTYEQFEGAVRRGVAPGGTMLYPAMPYPSYARVTDDDMKALYAYFMEGVAPVKQADKESTIPWPLSIRWPMYVWRMMFSPSAGAPTVVNSTDPVVARGAYLVEGLGHCGACHTPRGIAMEERALTGADADYLSGGAPIDGWVAKNLRGELRTGLGSWTEAEITQFLKTGRNPRTSVFGGMADVVKHSMQYMTDDDLTAIARYLKTLPANRTEPAYVYDESMAKLLHAGDLANAGPGAQTYLDNCAACHRTDGKGYARVFPALAGNSVVATADATSAIHIVLSGFAVPATRTAPSSFAMPALGWRLSDQEVADVVSFIRRSWGNDAPGVTPEEVATLRKQVAR